jgi:hypothetical protein
MHAFGHLAIIGRRVVIVVVNPTYQHRLPRRR